MRERTSLLGFFKTFLESVYKLAGGLFSNFFGFDHWFNFLDFLGPIFGGPFLNLVFDFLDF
jgi:hypothetical protein